MLFADRIICLPLNLLLINNVDYQSPAQISRTGLSAFMGAATTLTNCRYKAIVC